MKTTNFVMAVLCALIVTLVSSCGKSQDNKEIDISKINDENQIVSLIEKSIEEGDYNMAKQLNARYFSILDHFDGPRPSFSNYFKFKNTITKATVASLIDNGQYSIAADVAAEDLDYGVYYYILTNKLLQLYDNDPQGLLKALMSIKFPALNSEGRWTGGDNEYYTGWNVNELITRYNNSIKQLMLYAKTNNDTEYVNKLSVVLQPMHKKFEYENGAPYADGSPHMSTDFEQDRKDYSQVNEIKKEFGLK